MVLSLRQRDLLCGYMLLDEVHCLALVILRRMSVTQDHLLSSMEVARKWVGTCIIFLGVPYSYREKYELRCQKLMTNKGNLE